MLLAVAFATLCAADGADRHGTISRLKIRPARSMLGELTLSLATNLSVCSSAFHTPYGRAIPLSSALPEQLGWLQGGTPARVDCLTPLPRAYDSGSGFALAHAVRITEVPDTAPKREVLRNSRFDLDQWLGGSFGFGQGWWATTRNATLFVMLGGGSCGAWCAIAAAVAQVIERAWQAELPHQLAVLDVGAGVSTFSACLASNHNFQTMAMAPLESDADPEYMYQTYLAGARAIPTLLETMDARRPLPFPTDSFHAIMACYARGGGLKDQEWAWRAWGRVLKPAGLVFMEAAPPSTLNLTALCFERAPPSAPVFNRYNLRNRWKLFQKPMLIYRLKDTDACRGVHMYEQATDATGGPPPHDDAPPRRDARAALNWSAMVEWLVPRMQLSPDVLATLAVEDEGSWRFDPPAGSEPTLSIFPRAFANTSRAVHVLAAQARTPGLLQALRARAPHLWGLAPGGVRVSSVAPLAHRPSQHAGAVGSHVMSAAALVRHDWCSHAYPAHPRAFDLVVLEDAPTLIAHCLRRAATDTDSPLALLRHLLLETLRLLRPGPLGLLLLTGGNDDLALGEAADPGSPYQELDSLLLAALRRAGADVTLLGCTRADGAGPGSRACVLQLRHARA